MKVAFEGITAALSPKTDGLFIFFNYRSPRKHLQATLSNQPLRNGLQTICADDGCHVGAFACWCAEG